MSYGEAIKKNTIFLLSETVIVVILVSGKRFIFARTQQRLQEQLKQIKQQLGHNKIKNVCCILHSDYQILTIEKPKCEKKDRYNVLLWQLSEEFNLDQENIILSILPQQELNVSVSDGDETILVAFAIKNKISSLERTFKEINIQVQNITIYELAIFYYFYYQYPKEVKNKLIIYRTKNSMQVLLVVEHYFYRKFDIESDEGSSTEKMLAMLIFRALSVFRTIAQQDKKLVIYCNALPKESEFVSKLSQLVDYQITEYGENYDDIVSLPATGLYLAMQKASNRVDVNLCSTVPLQTIQFNYSLVKVFLLTFIFIMLLSNAAVFIYGKYLRHQANLQQNKIQVFNRELHKKLKNRFIALLPNHKSQTSAAMIQFFYALAKQYHPSLWLTRVEMVRNNNKVNVKLYGKAFNGNAVYQLLLSLSELESFNDLNFNHIEVDEKPLHLKKNGVNTSGYIDTTMANDSKFDGVYFLVATEKPTENKKNKRSRT